MIDETTEELTPEQVAAQIRRIAEERSAVSSEEPENGPDAETRAARSE